MPAVHLKRMKSLTNFISRFPKKIASFLKPNNGSYRGRREEKCFKHLLSEWWLMHGNVKWLHALNEIRIPLICNAFVLSKSMILSQYEPRKEFAYVKLLDVGCGGGICSERLAELNFNVTGIDPNFAMIGIAKDHQNKRRMNNKQLKYIHTTIEEFAKNHENEFDGVIVSEVLDRVPFFKKKQFLEQCIRCAKPDGHIFVTVKNQTKRSYYVLLISTFFSWSRGLSFRTQSWLRCVQHEWLTTVFKNLRCDITRVNGIGYDLTIEDFRHTEKLHTWYFMQARKSSFGVVKY